MKATKHKIEEIIKLFQEGTILRWEPKTYMRVVNLKDGHFNLTQSTDSLDTAFKTNILNCDGQIYDFKNAEGWSPYEIMSTSGTPLGEVEENVLPIQTEYMVL